MNEVEANQRRLKHLSKTISEKIETVSKLRNDLEKKKKTVGNSVDEQIVMAELEYRLIKEEMALLSCQEQHWESAALWDVSHSLPPQRDKEMWEVVHDFTLSLKERGVVPALHASQHLHLENSLLISCQVDGIPKVEWAHQDTELQNGDRLVEVNGHLVIGKNSSEVNQMLMSSGGVCRLIYLRPLSLHQMMKGSAGCKETSNLRQELTTVVTRLNHKMMESTQLTESNLKLQKENDDLMVESRKLKLQLVTLQSILLYMLQVMEKSSPTALSFSLLDDLLKNGPAEEGIICHLQKRFPSLQQVSSSDEEEKS